MNKYKTLYLTTSSRTAGLTCYTEDGKKVSYPEIKDLQKDRNNAGIVCAGWSYIREDGSIDLLTEQMLCAKLGCDHIVNEL